MEFVVFSYACVGSHWVLCHPLAVQKIHVRCDSKLAVSVNVSVDGCLMGALRSPNNSEFFCVTPPQLPLGKLKQNNVPPSYQSKMAALNINNSKIVNF